MSTIKQYLIVVAANFLLVASVVAEIRTWTDAQGRTVQAEFLRTQKAGPTDMAVLKKADGQEIQISMNYLSQNDRTWIEEKSKKDREKELNGIIEQIIDVEPTVNILSSGNEPRTKLRYHRSKGEKADISVHIQKQVNLQVLGMADSARSASKYNLSIEVFEVTPSGDVTYLITPTGADFEMPKSAASIPELVRVHDIINTEIKKVSGSITFSDRGALKSVKVDGSQIKERPAVKDQIVGMAFNCFSSLGPLVLPESEVGVGARWKINDVTTDPSLTAKGEIEIKSINGNDVLLKETSQVKLDDKLLRQLASELASELKTAPRSGGVLERMSIESLSKDIDPSIKLSQNIEGSEEFLFSLDAIPFENKSTFRSEVNFGGKGKLTEVNNASVVIPSTNDASNQLITVKDFNFEETKAKAEAMKPKTLVFKSFYLGMPIGDAQGLINHLTGRKQVRATALHLGDDPTAGMKEGTFNPDSPEFAGNLAGELAGALTGIAMEFQKNLSPEELRAIGYDEKTIATFEQSKPENSYRVFSRGDLSFVSRGGFKERPFAVADSSGAVTRFELSPETIRELFGSMPASEFLETFIESYNLPGLESESEPITATLLGMKREIGTQQILRHRDSKGFEVTYYADSEIFDYSMKSAQDTPPNGALVVRAIETEEKRKAKFD